MATAPCHIAALPLAINMGCSAMRRITVPLACQPAERLDGGFRSIFARCRRLAYRSTRRLRHPPNLRHCGNPR
ncbi:MAG: hypothetical protein ACLR3C_08440 [Eggerthella lenta]